MTNKYWLTIFCISLVGMFGAINPVVAIGASITGVLAFFNLFLKTAR